MNTVQWSWFLKEAWCSITISGSVWLGYQPSHVKLGWGWTIFSEAIYQGDNQNVDQNLLGRAEKLSPVRPITDTKSKLLEVESDTAHGAKSWGSNGDGLRLRTRQKHKVPGNFQEYSWNLQTRLYASICAYHMRCHSGWKKTRMHKLFILF